MNWEALLALLVVGFFAGGLALVIVVIVSLRSLSRRVDALEHARKAAEIAASTARQAPLDPGLAPPPPAHQTTMPTAPLATTPPPPPAQPAPDAPPQTASAAPSLPQPARSPAKIPSARVEEDWSDGEPRAQSPAAASADATHATSATAEHVSPPPVRIPDPPPRIEWERWLGVRGAAVLGGVVVAIAGLLFLQYSIEHNLITGPMRVKIGAVIGLLGFAGAVPLRKRGYVAVANAITGAGAALLYAVAWAAHVLYGMIGFPAAFVAMVAVTAACALFAARHGSLVIAVLGLVGGFATPIALSSGADRPVALFGYVLLIDLAFLFVAEKRRWPSLGLLALAGTFVVQALWVLVRMDSGGLPIALISLGVFALFFAAFIARFETGEKKRWNTTQIGAVILPFVFAVYFAQHHDLGAHVWPLAALAVVLSIAAAWMARTRELAWLSVGSASGGVALALTWTANRVFMMSRAEALELVVCGFVLVLTHVVVSELAARAQRSAEHTQGARGGAIVSAIGFQFVAVFAAGRPYEVEPWLWLGLSLALALAAFRQAALGARPWIPLVASTLTGVTAFVWVAKHGASELMPDPVMWCGALGLSGALILATAWSVRRLGSQLPFWGVGGFVVPAVFGLLTLGDRFMDSIAVHVALIVVLGIQVAFAATAARASALFIVGLATTCIALVLTGTEARRIAPTDSFPVVFACVLAASVIFAAWPAARSAPWAARTGTWRSAAFSTLPFFFLVRALFEARWPGSPVFYLPFGFELLTGAVAYSLFNQRASEDRAQRIGRIWFSCAAILFAAMIVPLEVDREPLAITLALFGAGVAAIHTRIDARPLAWVAAGALVVAFMILDLGRIWGVFPHSDVRVWNWVAYTHLLPGIAAIVATTFLRRAGGGVPATTAGICAILFVFAWINLEIANAFASEARFTLQFGHTPARGLTVSIAWAIYALVLLALGVSKQRGALRWASLVLMLCTIGKVFLSDLGHLSGLYRAASVFGLGLSLLAVSLLYQRFVFRRPTSPS
ncbi:MAG: DUF2339 domain-containing protein [Planctomycetes bacterium]|nr:DUF2339 domain-containing protein [Planctomycetota bacterium]